MKVFYYALTAFALIASSCERAEKVDLSKNSNQNEEVKLESALKVAHNFDLFITALKSRTEEKNVRTGNSEKTLKKVTPVKDENGKAFYYIISYNEGGFIIISAEKKMMPLIAFSETNDFPVENLPDGVKETMEVYQSIIRKLRMDEVAVDSTVIQEWIRFENTSANKLINSGARTMDNPSDPPCEDSQVYYGPLLSTNWGQGCGYNAQMPVLAGCISPCNHAYTGCVATAMSQVMNYHHFPNTFNWNSMGVSAPETNRLMRANANNVSMTYMCNGSGALPSMIRGALVNVYGFNSGASHTNFNSSVIMNEIGLYSRPVILSGWNSAGDKGHTWVADGYFQTYNCSNGWSQPMIHMNWG